MWLRQTSLVRKLVSLVLGIFLFIISAVPAYSVKAEPAALNDTVDFVLVIDCSSSLTRTDPKKLTLEAAKKFVDMLPVNNTRLAVVAFGDDYGLAAYKINKKDKISEQRVKVVYDLQEISGDKKSIVHKAINKDITPTGDYSPLGYAYETACQILQKGKALDGSAAIILLSDGQVEGQEDIYNRTEFDSIDSANSIAASSRWPVYCMELNYANETGNGTDLGKIAYHQMRENIPGKTGTDPIELKSAEQAAEEFEKIFAAMYPESNFDHDTGEIRNGKKEFDIKVDEMTAEQNITLTGDVAKFTNIEIEAPSGGKTTIKQGEQKTQGAILSNFEVGYVSMKILTPEAGRWNVTVNGTDHVVIGLTSVGFKKTNLELSSDVSGGEVKPGTKVNFTVRYVYNDYAYTSDSFYKNHPARMSINGKETIDMTAGADSYRASYTFEKKGTYKVLVNVDDKSFKGGRKESNSLSFTIENTAPEAVDKIPDQVAGVKKDTEEIDLTKYFRDDDALRYYLEYDRSVGISHEVRGNDLVIKGGTRKGTYEVTVAANDGSKEEDAIQTFYLNVVNEPVTLLGESTETIELTYDSDSEKTRHILWDEYFADADGIPPRIAIMESSNDGITWTEDNDQKGMTVCADAAGSAVIEVIAVDYSDLTESRSVTFRISADGGWQKVIHDNKIPFGIGGLLLVAVLAVLLGGFAGRKIYGTWDIDVGQGTDTDRVIGKVRSGKKASCRVNSLLSDLDFDADFGSVMLKAGNNYSKAVYITNLEKLASVEYNDEMIDDYGRGKKFLLKPGSSIRLRTEDGQSLYLYRSK